MGSTKTHIAARFKRRIAAGMIACLTLSLSHVALPATAIAASSWKPTLLVNTEAFQVIDDDDTTADIVMRFGDTINKSLTYERAAGQFKFDDDLEVVGTLSGSSIFANIGLFSSGSLVIDAPLAPAFAGGLKDATNLNGVSALDVVGRYAYVVNVNDDSLRIIDVSNPSSPVIVGGIKDETNLSWPVDIAVEGRYAYVLASGDSTLRIVDVSNPSDPVIVGVSTDTVNPVSLTVAGQYVYVASDGDGSLRIINVSDPTRPLLAGSVQDAVFSGFYSIAVAGRYAYAANIYDESLRVIDISNPALPVIVGGVQDDSLSGARSVVVAGRYAYVANNFDDSLRIIDISDPASPSIVGGVKDATNLNGANTVAVAGRYAYVTSNTDDSMRIIDISNPATPSIVGGIKDATDLNNPVDIAVVGRYAYVTNYTDNSLRIIDLQGFEAPTASIGALEAGTLNVLGDGNINGNLSVKKELNVGEGMMVFGQSAIRSLSGTALRLSSAKPGGKPVLEVAGAISGSTIYATGTLRSSGSLVWEGAASGASLYLGGKLEGAGLTDCDTSDTSKLLWDATTGRFSCGTDQTGGSSLTAGQGLTLNGTALSVSSTISGSLLEFQTVSGSTVYGGKSVRSSGSLVWEGTASGATAHIMNRLGVGTGSPKTKLEAIGTISGSLVTQNGAGSNYFMGNLGIGTTTPSAAFEIFGQLIDRGNAWTARSAAAANPWQGIAYGNGMFVAVATSGTNQVMTSPDGITWTARSAASGWWKSVTYGNGMFVAVAISGTNRVMTSPDGITWTARSAAEANNWQSVAYGNGMFVAVAYDGTNRVMTSPDGITWTARSAAEANNWYDVVYGNGLFVAVASSGTNRVMTSPDGITWTARSAAEANSWNSVTYGNGLFVAVATGGTNRVMTSPDGITWTARSAAEANSWDSIAYGNGLFVAVAQGGTNRVMTSPDGITWTARSAAEANTWRGVTFGNGTFVAVSSDGTNRAMTSGKSHIHALSHNNTYQGGMNILGGNVGIGTSSPDTTLDVVGTVSGSSIQSFGLTDCDTGASSKLLWDATTGRFSCGTDQTGGSSLTAGQGLSLNGTALSVSSTISGSLLEFQTVSGSTVYGSKSVRSSGSLVWEGSASGNTLFVSGNATFAEDLTFGNAINDAITVNAATWTFANDTTFVLSGTNNMLEIVGTTSGSVLHANRLLRSSGALLVESGAYIDDTTFYVDANGNRVGIGTTSPQRAFHYESSSPILRIADGNSTNTTDATGYVEFFDRNNSNVLGYMGFTSTGDGNMEMRNSLNANLELWTNNLQRATLTSDGDLGIGKISPSTKLDVVGTISGATVLTRNLLNSTSATTGSVLVSRTNGTAEWKTPDGAMTWYIDGDIATGTSQSATVIMPFGMTLTDVDLVVKTAPTGQALIVDINENGSTLFSTRPEIDAAGTREDGNHVFSDAALAAGSSITVDIDQVGSGTAGAGLTIMLKGTRHY